MFISEIEIKSDFTFSYLLAMNQKKVWSKFLEAHKLNDWKGLGWIHTKYSLTSLIRIK